MGVRHHRLAPRGVPFTSLASLTSLLLDKIGRASAMPPVILSVLVLLLRVAASVARAPACDRRSKDRQRAIIETAACNKTEGEGNLLLHFDTGVAAVRSVTKCVARRRSTRPTASQYVVGACAARRTSPVNQIGAPSRVPSHLNVVSAWAARRRSTRSTMLVVGAFAVLPVICSFGRPRHQAHDRCRRCTALACAWLVDRRRGALVASPAASSSTTVAPVAACRAGLRASRQVVVAAAVADRRCLALVAWPAT